jgi:hydrogenase maturation factor
MKKLPLGKIKMELLSRLLEKHRGREDPSVIIGPQVGEDAAVIELNKEYLIAKTDPITFATDQIGEYTININANDIACMGGKPRWFLATLLLPEEKTDETLLELIFSQLSDACKRLGISLCGGHTEVTYGLERPIVIGQMLGVVPRERLVRSSGSRIGDHILLTKGIAVEATSLLAREKERELSAYLGRDFLERCKGFLTDPGISILREAELAVETGGVHAMHDPTEGGLATGLHELASASEVGVEVWHDKINIFPETERLCKIFNLNPLGLIASGALLIVTAPSYSEKVIATLNEEGISCTHIGVVTERSSGLILVKETGKTELPCFDQDEISKVF